jgi:Tfp pilus assembly protein PilF
LQRYCITNNFSQKFDVTLYMQNQVSRIEQLQQWIAEDAQDHFSRYALALEYGKIHEIAKMRETFEYLLQNAPEYLPTYYHAGALYEELGEIVLAEATFAQGIKQATLQQDAHALHELKNIHTNLLMEYDVESTL